MEVLTTETVNIHEAKTHLSRLLKRVEDGEEVIIARHGQPVARLVPLARRQRQLGLLAGRISIGEDFDAPLPEGLEQGYRGEG